MIFLLWMLTIALSTFVLALSPHPLAMRVIAVVVLLGAALLATTLWKREIRRKAERDAGKGQGKR